MNYGEQTSKFKKMLMTHMWRFQQSQAIYGAIFWALALAGIFYERSQFYFEKYLFLSSNPNEQVITKMAILMFLVFLFIIVFGFLYDITFRLWEEQSIVKAERNVYAQYKLMTRWIITYHEMFIPLLKHMDKGEADDDIAFMERWMEKLLVEDPVINMYYDHVTDWIKSDSMRWEPPAMDTLRTAYRKKE